MANIALKTLMKTDLVEMIKSVISNSKDYYLFVSRISPFEDVSSTAITESDVNPPSISESTKQVHDAIRNCLFIKRIKSENMRIVVRRINWKSGTTYTEYSDVTDLDGKDYYVMTPDYNVYKCMKSTGASTIMPSGRSVNVITTADGYQWKYIYTVAEDYLGFLTLEYMPVYISSNELDEQRLVQRSSLPGSIDVVSFNASVGPSFPKVFSNEIYFTNNTNLFTDLGIQANIAGSSYISFNPSTEVSNPASGYWNNYAVYITDGPGIGQYFRIVDFKKGGDAGGSYYYANVYPTITRTLLSEGTSTPSKFKLVPYMVVDGDGEDAIVVPGTASKKITSLNIVNPGKNYTYAKPRVVSDAADVTIGTSVQALNETINASLSIPGGHGFNAIREFQSSNLMIVVDIDGTEGGKISNFNDYRQFGILKSPYLYGGITLAGQEEKVVLQVNIRKEPTKEIDYALSSFVTGNYIIGKETRASAKILDRENTVGSKFYRLYLTDVVGNFRFSDDKSTKARVYFTSSFTGPIGTGDYAFQYQNLDGYTLSASGRIVSGSTVGQNLVIDTTYGAFVSGATISLLGKSGGYTLNKSSILDVDEEYGEMLGQFSVGNTSGSSFLSFAGDENFGRLASVEFLPTPAEDIGEYIMTTRIRITSASPLTNGVLAGSAALDGNLKQTDSITLKKTVADIIEYTASGFTGMIHLSNVKGSFNKTDSLFFTPYGSTAENALSISINEILNPDIEVGSGDLLYIENVRPIERNIEQSEEFKIVIGF